MSKAERVTLIIFSSFSLFNQHVLLFGFQSVTCFIVLLRALCLPTPLAMALRRFAQENNAFTSPEAHKRLSFGVHRSPADTPSISSSIPFDWEAARAQTAPPYSTPLKSRPRKSVGTPSLRKAVVRKKSLLEKFVPTYIICLLPNSYFSRIKSFPSRIAFEVALFPNNIPLPTQKVSARIIGGTIHFLHFWILASHDNDDGWDSVSGVKNTAWFDWVSILLLTDPSIFSPSPVNTHHHSPSRYLHIQHIFLSSTHPQLQISPQNRPSSLSSREICRHKA